MTAGDPIPRLDPRQYWLAYFCFVGPNPNSVEKLSQKEEEGLYRNIPPLLREMNFASRLDEKPEE